jgi:nitrogen fixation protein FixH
MQYGVGTLLVIVVSTAFAAALTGCGGDASAPSAAHSESFVSQSGALTVTVDGEPIRGVNTIVYEIRDTDGQPVDGLGFSVVPWMPAMGHGASVTPSVTPRGGGVYDVSNVVLFMPGRWELRTTFSATHDGVTPAFDIQ